MKNIFKLLGVALIASSMIFVACTKDPEDNNNNNNNTTDTTTHGGGTTDTTSGGGGNDQPTETIMAMTVNGQNYDVAEFGAGQASGKFIIIPACTAGYAYIVSGQAVGTFSGDDYYSFWFTGDDEADYFTYNNTEYPTWEGLEGDYQQEITAIDMNAQTISFTYSETLSNCVDYVNGDDPATMTVAVNIQNGEWETINFQKKNTNRIK